MIQYKNIAVLARGVSRVPQGEVGTTSAVHGRTQLGGKKAVHFLVYGLPSLLNGAGVWLGSTGQWCEELSDVTVPLAQFEPVMALVLAPNLCTNLHKIKSFEL